MKLLAVFLTLSFLNNEPTALCGRRRYTPGFVDSSQDERLTCCGGSSSDRIV